MWKKSLVAILLLAGIGYYFYKPEQKPNYLTETVKKGNIEKTVVATGNVDSLNKVNVGAQVSGKITKLHVEVGQYVKKGDLIAEIDSTEQKDVLDSRKASVSSYEAQLKARQTALEVAQSNYNRLVKLKNQNATSQTDLDNAKNVLDSAKAEVNVLKDNIKKANIDLNTAKTNVGYTIITAPIDGTIISTPIKEGQTINSAQSAPTIVVIADLTNMKIKPEISEGDITKIKAGQKVSFTILSSDKKFDSVIKSVDPGDIATTNNSSSSGAIYYYANIEVPNPDNVLRIGMTTESSIEIAKAENVLTMSNMALKERDGKYFVFLLEGEKDKEMAVEKEVQIGLQNDFQTEVKGLKEGDKVIVSQVDVGEQVGEKMRRPF